VQASNPLPSTDEYRIKNNRSDMVYIPSGSFVAGRLHQELATASSDEPLAQVTQVDAFYVDRYEYPNVRGEVPVHMVSYTRALETCEAFGKRLCTAVEWEKACKGTRNSIYAYGDTWDEEICGNYRAEDYTMGAYSQCHSSFSAFDMSGGLREWTSGTGGARADRRAVKGGSISNPEQGYRCAFTEYLRENYGSSDGSLGFRCCLDAD
jgi:formylglycine-generating enzyme required for sulfatase activity